jgi:hypothetical protein
MRKKEKKRHSHISVGMHISGRATLIYGKLTKKLQVFIAKPKIRN